MALIFVLSHQPDLSSGLGVWDLVGRKIIHAGEYALLCLLWWRALATTTTRGWALAVAAAISVAYAISDEVHQTFIEGRNGTPLDVAIDSAGVAAAAACLHRWRR
jgi:VanZ family protein